MNTEELKTEILINELIEIIHSCENDLNARINEYCEAWIKTYYPDVNKQYRFSSIDKAYRKYNKTKEVK